MNIIEQEKLERFAVLVRADEQARHNKALKAQVSAAEAVGYTKGRAEALEEAAEIAKTIGGKFADDFLAAIRRLK